MAEGVNKGGRPSEYSQDKADAICELLAMGYSLRTVCSEDNMPSAATVFKWMREHDEFLKQYEKAKQESTDAMAEDLLDIADDGTNDWVTKTNKDGSEYETVNAEVIARSRLRVDTRKWLMAKMKPKKYGEKIDMTSDGEKLQAVLVKFVGEDGTTKDD